MSNSNTSIINKKTKYRIIEKIDYYGNSTFTPQMLISRKYFIFKIWSTLKDYSVYGAPHASCKTLKEAKDFIKTFDRFKYEETKLIHKVN